MEDDPTVQQEVARHTYLIVDDVSSARLLLAATLHGLGAKEVIPAIDGVDALEKLRSAAVTPDIVFCDWVMPKMDGIEVLREIKAHYPNVRVVMFTSKKDHDDVKLAKANGVDSYLLKPFSRETVAGVLHRLLAT